MQEICDKQYRAGPAIHHGLCGNQHIPLKHQTFLQKQNFFFFVCDIGTSGSATYHSTPDWKQFFKGRVL